MEVANKRNIKRLDSYDRIKRLNLRPLEADKKQVELTEKWILPYSDLIVSDLQEVRKKVDRELVVSKEIVGKLKYKGNKYPVGVCGEIADGVLEEIFGTSGYNNNMQGMKMLRNFVREGGGDSTYLGSGQRYVFPKCNSSRIFYV